MNLLKFEFFIRSEILNSYFPKVLKMYPQVSIVTSQAVFTKQVFFPPSINNAIFGGNNVTGKFFSSHVSTLDPLVVSVV